jgi:hypothetical protein
LVYPLRLQFYLKGSKDEAPLDPVFRHLTQADYASRPIEEKDRPFAAAAHGKFVSIVIAETRAGISRCAGGVCEERVSFRGTARCKLQALNVAWCALSFHGNPFPSDSHIGVRIKIHNPDCDFDSHEVNSKSVVL